MNTRRQRIAIVGAGPIGLEAALFAVQSGYDVRVFERGRVGENVLDWGHVRLFSPFGLNASEWGRSALSGSGDESSLPDDEELLTGREFAKRYLLPLSRLPQLKGRIHENTDVLAIGKSRHWKGDAIGQPERGDDPFQLLLREDDGERLVEADLVFDCSGTYPRHNWLGAGGIPCIGESRALLQTDYRLPDILGTERDRFAGQKTLVVGGGYSAATAVVSLARLAAESPGTRVVWLTRSERTPPLIRIENDPLPERDRLAETANRLALASEGPVQWQPGRLIRRIDRTPSPHTPLRVGPGRRTGPATPRGVKTGSKVPPGRRDLQGEGQGVRAGYVVTVEPVAGGRGRPKGAPGNAALGGRFAPPQPPPVPETLTVDRVIANVGYRPDGSLYEELQVHECYATQGPMKLAAALLGETSADCLAQSGYGAETLCHPEPGFFILGSKSYGRDSRFLIRTGLQQIRDVFCMLGHCE